MTALEERWLWLSGSVALAILASWIRWLFFRVAHAPPWLRQWHAWEGRRWVEQVGRLLYALGIPAAALLWRGVLTERGLGLQPVLWLQESVALDVQRANLQDWVLDLGWTLSIAFVTGLIFSLGAYQQRRLHQTTPQAHHDIGVALQEAVYHESHWAFYREPFVLLWGVSLGSWIGLMPALLEGMLSPQRWDDMQSPDRGRDLLLRGALAVMSTLIFLQTQNSWCALGADIVLGYVLGVAHVGGDASPPR